MGTTSRVLILGGGFGGVAAANRLRELLPDGDEIVLADRATHFMMGFRKTDVIVGRPGAAEARRPLAALEGRGIRVVCGEIGRIDPAGRAAEVGGERIEADALLVALGAETVPGAVPGLAEHGVDVYGGGVERAAAALARLDGGRLVVGIFGQPYKCPPAPFELALLARDALAERGVSADITVFSPLPASLPVAGKAACESIEGRMSGLGIAFRPSTAAERVADGRVAVGGGEEIAFDLLFAVPPHRVPAAVVDAGLAPAGGWIKVDPRTLATGHDGVWAVGDCVGIMMANGKPMPKSGAFAAGAGEVAASHIAARLAGGSSDERFWADGECYLEVGGGEAMIVRGRFLAQPEPEVELTAASPEHLAAKERFERERLDAWFA